MLQVTDEERNLAFESADEKQRYLYANPASGVRLWEIAEKYHLTGDQVYTDFVTIVGDVVLDLSPRTNLPNILTETLKIPNEQSIQITGYVIDFIDNPEKNTGSEKLVSNATEAKTTPQTVPRLRTMAEDVNNLPKPEEEVVYTSTQEAILKERQPRPPVLADQNKPKPTSNIPKWDSAL